MATLAQFESAFADGARNIIVASVSGKLYWVNRDQRPCILEGGLCYGVPTNPHPRMKNKIVWMEPENVTIE